MRIIHLSDSHLGYKDLSSVPENGVNVREQDFYDSLKNIVSHIIESKPDIVIHTGDFFHRPSPSNRAMIAGLKQLKLISDQNIPVVIIAGNHETPRTNYSSPILEALQSIDNVYPFFKQEYDKVKFGNLVIHGLPHINEDDKMIEEIEKISIDKDCNNILMMHVSLGEKYRMEQFGERIFPEEHINELVKFDYIALGHWHKYQQLKILKNACYSGSIERLSDRETGYDKGYIEINISNDGTIEKVFHKINVRPWFRFDIKECQNKSIEEIRDEVIEYANKNNTTGALISIYLHQLKPFQAVEIANSWIQDQFPDSLSVIIKRIFKDKSGHGERVDLKTESLDVLFDRYVKKHIEEDSNAGVLAELGKSYFQMYERGEHS